MRAAWILQGVGFALLIVAVVYLADTPREVPHTDSSNTATTMQHILIRSPAFNHEERIPSKYTCDGEDTPPPLAIDQVPRDTVTLALIMDDPDAPGGTWDHWVLFNMPPTLTRIGEASSVDAVQGVNSWGRLGYGGPCPPDGEHRYLLKVYALDTRLALEEGASKSDVLTAIEGHVLDSTTLMGRYERVRDLHEPSYE